MKKQRFEIWVLLSALVGAIGSAGCSSTAGNAAADLGLGVAGYELSDHEMGGAAAGAAVGYVGSQIAQSAVKSSIAEAEQRGYDRALNQAVKQQYWIIQSQQHSRETPLETPGRLLPVVIPETKINGVLRTAHVEYVRLEQ